MVRYSQSATTTSSRYTINGAITQTDLTQPGVAARMIEARQPDILYALAGHGVDPVKRGGGEKDQVLSLAINSCSKAG